MYNPNTLDLTGRFGCYVTKEVNRAPVFLYYRCRIDLISNYWSPLRWLSRQSLGLIQSYSQGATGFENWKIKRLNLSRSIQMIGSGSLATADSTEASSQTLEHRSVRCKWSPVSTFFWNPTVTATLTQLALSASVEQISAEYNIRMSSICIFPGILAYSVRKPDVPIFYTWKRSIPSMWSGDGDSRSFYLSSPLHARQ